jgi:cobalt-precorrin 5A hydrolase
MPVSAFCVGLGARSRVPEKDLDEALDAALAAAGVRAADIAFLATIDRRAREDAMRAVAGRRSWILRAFAAEELARVPVPSPSAAGRIGAGSVAEAAALLAAGPAATLILPKRVSPCVTVAIAKGVLGATGQP